MAHVGRFAGIPMSKCMRDMCKEEDYAFLNSQEEPNRVPGESTLQCSELQHQREERLHRRLEREKEEMERQRELERQRRKKDEEWRRHVAQLASERKSVHERLHRLREFRDFQKKVLMQDMGLDPGTDSETLNQLLMRL